MDRRPLNIDACPSPTELEAYAGQQLIGKRNEEIYLHLRHCGTCLRKLARLTSVPSPETIIHGAVRLGLWQRIKAWLTRRRGRR